MHYAHFIRAACFKSGTSIADDARGPVGGLHVGLASKGLLTIEILHDPVYTQNFLGFRHILVPKGLKSCRISHQQDVLWAPDCCLGCLKYLRAHGT